MRKSDLGEIKNFDIKALKEKAKTLREEINSLVIEKGMNKLKDVKVLSKKRRDLAQTLTILRQKELLQDLEQKGAK